MVILEENDSRRFAAIEQSAEELRWDVGKLKNTTERLETSNNELVSKVTGLEQRLDSQSQLLATIYETLRRLDPSNREARQADKAIATSSNSPNQGTDNFLVSPGSEQHIGYRNIAEALANQDSIMREVDMPVFNGSSPFGWIARVERIFRLGEYSDNQKLDLVSVSLEGPGLSWFNWAIEHELFRDWADFKQRMLDQFAESWYAESGKRLCCIQKTSPIKDYVTEFEELSSQVKGKGDYEKVSELEVNEPGKQVNFVGTIDIETIPEISPVTDLICSSPKVLLQHISNPEVVQEASSTGAKELLETSLIYEKESLTNETIRVMEHEEDTNVMPVSHVHELDELSLDLQVALVFKKESVPAIVCEKDLVEQVDSPNVQQLQCGSAVVIDKHETYQMFDRLFFRGNQLHQRRTVRMKRIENQSIIVVGEFKMKHKWRDKLTQQVFKLKLFLNRVVIILGADIWCDYMDKVMVAILLLQRLMIQPKQKQTKCNKAGVFKYSHKTKKLAKWDITTNHLLLIKQTNLWFCIQVNLFFVQLQQQMKLHQFSKSKLCKYHTIQRIMLSLDLTKWCELWRKQSLYALMQFFSFHTLEDKLSSNGGVLIRHEEYSREVKDYSACACERLDISELQQKKLG